MKTWQDLYREQQEAEVMLSYFDCLGYKPDQEDRRLSVHEWVTLGRACQIIHRGLCHQLTPTYPPKEAADA